MKLHDINKNLPSNFRFYGEDITGLYVDKFRKGAMGVVCEFDKDYDNVVDNFQFNSTILKNWRRLAVGDVEEREMEYIFFLFNRKGYVALLVDEHYEKSNDFRDGFAVLTPTEVERLRKLTKAFEDRGGNTAEVGGRELKALRAFKREVFAKTKDRMSLAELVTTYTVRKVRR